MDKHTYEPFLKHGGTPICCRSSNEVDLLIKDISSIFPDTKNRLSSISRVFGCMGYESEVVYRFAENDEGIISTNFCTYEFYRKHGYEIVEFADILAANNNGYEDDLAWELEDLAVLFE